MIQNICFGIWCTNLNEPNWKLSTCTCPHFYKKHTCKNIIGNKDHLAHVKTFLTYTTCVKVVFRVLANVETLGRIVGVVVIERTTTLSSSSSSVSCNT
ncbi:hypothetical protein BpHYR1_002578 [Brachionus plicatilis]|uniref:SWIM-type domain-containing protein n=1 Tax=Brachionus plicatilis TaxID=10195 RepID=A0A3M7PBQ0_BRAPC|nr:hypothetical protein BpHYR1_002578 [Brachionus plicatilis]